MKPFIFGILSFIGDYKSKTWLGRVFYTARLGRVFHTPPVTSESDYLTRAASVAERLRVLFLNHSIISPLCLVWARAPLWPHVRQAKFCLGVCQFFFLGVYLPLIVNMECEKLLYLLVSWVHWTDIKMCQTFMLLES